VKVEIPAAAALPTISEKLNCVVPESERVMKMGASGYLVDAGARSRPPQWK
jgi:hypothetical protein